VAVEVIIDTNRYRDFCDAEPHAVEVFRRAHAIHIPIIVVAELRAGFALGSQSAKNESVLARFLTRPRVRVLLADMTTTHDYARLFRQLRAAGTPIPTNDLWIAALAAQHDLPLFTRDGHFDYLPQLPRVD
jgi:tRNA(fMet)-specific endonuclease VapC